MTDSIVNDYTRLTLNVHKCKIEKTGFIQMFTKVSGLLKIQSVLSNIVLGLNIIDNIILDHFGTDFIMMITDECIEKVRLIAP